MAASNPFRSQPVAIGIAARAVLVVCSRFWWHLSPDDFLIVWGAVEAVLGVFTYNTVLTPTTVEQAGHTVEGLTAAAKINVAVAKVEEAKQEKANTDGGYPPTQKPLPPPTVPPKP